MFTSPGKTELGQVAREGGLATIQLLDLYVHFKLPLLRATGKFAMVDDAKSGGQKPVTEGVMAEKIILEDFGIDVTPAKIRKVANGVIGEPGKGGTKSMIALLAGTDKAGRALPFNNGNTGTDAEKFMLRSDMSTVLPAFGPGIQEKYKRDEVIAVAVQISQSRAKILSGLLALLNNKQTTDAYESGNYFGGSGSSGLGEKAKAMGGNFQNFISVAWRFPTDGKGKSLNKTTPRQNILIMVDLLRVTTNSEPGDKIEMEGSNKKKDPTKEWVDEIMKESPSGMRALKVISLLQTVATRTRNSEGLTPQQNAARDRIASAVRGSILALAPGAVASKNGDFKQILKGMPLIKLVDGQSSSGESQQTRVGNNALIHSILNGALSSFGGNRRQFLDGLWYAFTTSTLHQNLTGMSMGSRGKKFEHVASATSYVQGDGSFAPLPTKLADDDYTRYVFDRQVLGFILNGALGDQTSGKYNMSSSVVRKEGSRVKGLRGLDEKSIATLLSVPKGADGRVTESGARSAIPVLKKVRAGSYNIAALRAIAGYLGAHVPDKVFYRDVLINSIRNMVLTLWVDAAGSGNAVATAAVAASLGINGLGDALASASAKGRIMAAIRAQLDAHFGIMSASFDCKEDKKSVRTEDLTTVAKLNGVDLGGATKRDDICAKLTAAGVLIQRPAPGAVLSGQRSEPAARKVESKSSSPAPSALFGAAPSQGQNSVFGAAPAVQGQNQLAFGQLATGGQASTFGTNPPSVSSSPQAGVNNAFAQSGDAKPFSFN